MKRLLLVSAAAWMALAAACILGSDSLLRAQTGEPQQVAPDLIPQSGTFHLLSQPNLPPLPFLDPALRDLNVPVYWFGPDAAGNSFWVDDTSAAAALQEQKETDQALRSLEKQYGLDSPDSPPPPPGGGGGGSGSGGGSSYTQPDYGTNLWIAQVRIASGYLTGIASNTVADVEYEIQSLTDLTQTNWVSQEFIVGSETTNWTPLTPLAVSRTNNVFLRIRSWADDGSGLPIWWQGQYFGTTGVDPYAFSPSGDGWTTLQSYQNGWNPWQWHAPPAPQGLTAFYNPANGTVSVSWQPCPGPVTNYAVVLSPASYGQSPMAFSIATTAFVTNYPFFYDDAQSGSPTCQVQAQYPGGPSGWSSVSLLNPYTSTAGQVVRGSQGTVYLAVSPMPQTATAFRLTRYDYSVYPAGLTNFDLPVSEFTNGLCALPATCVSPLGGAYEFWVQTWNSDGSLSNPSFAGYPSTWPFFDGQEQLEQNLSFLLRAGNATESFHYNSFGPGSPGDYDSPTNYAYAGYYNFDKSTAPPTPVLAEFLPFQENYLDRNFVFSTNDIDSTGQLTTGVTQEIMSWYLDLTYPPAYVFTVPTNLVTIPAILGATIAQWTAFGPYDLLGVDWGDQLDALAEININGSFSTLYMTGTTRNIFGLPYLSAKLAYSQNGGLQLSTLSAGGSVPAVQSYVYSQTAQPTNQTINYYFARPGIDPFPGDGQFSPTNTTPPLLLAGFAQTLSLGGYAKQRILNGHTNQFAYLGQYFDQAYTLDGNGNVTTNSAGLLSPYGEFFPMQPGPAALVTMADIDTGQRGTGVVNVAKLQTDVDYNGQMDLSFAGPDNTSQARPLLMWVNNGHTEPGTGGNPDKDLSTWGNPPANLPNYSYGAIRCQRNLENFARLWACGLPKLPPSQGYTVTLTMSPSSGNPAINLYAAFTNSAAYLTDTNAAAAQFTKMYLGNQLIFDYSKELAAINTSQSYNLPLSSDGTPQYTNFLFEGAGIGAGQLTLTISQTTAQGSNVIAQTSAWLDLHDVKDFFEQAYATNVTSGKPPSSLVSDFSVIQTAASPAPDETKQIIVFIHGINNTVTDYETTTRTIFKRLYWAGYHGRFASFRWPCSYLWPTAKDPFLFNLGEFYAFKSATALKNYLSYLRNNRPDLAGYAIDLYAHSQGNVVTSEAILQGAPFDNYILSQGAFPAHCYDTNAPFLQQLLDAETNSVNAVQTPFYPVDGGYHGYCSSIHGNLIDFYNTNDFALATGTTLGLQTNWKEDQRTQKPEAFIGGPSYIYDPSTHVTTGYYTFGNSYTVTDLQEIKALVARSRSAAVGAQGGLHGAISGSVDLFSSYGFGNTRDEHSAQFARPIQTCLPYYRRMLTSFQIVTP